MKPMVPFPKQLPFILTVWRGLSNNWIMALANKFVVIFFILGMILIVSRWTSLPPQLPLWYAKPWGDDQLAWRGWIFILPVGALLIYLVNLILSVYLAAEYLIFAQILALTSLVVSLMSLIALAKIIFLVT